MKRKIFIYILICIMGIMCTSCRKESSASTVRETANPETETEYVLPEINTVEALEDDGMEMSAAEALQSAMKGKHSVLEMWSGHGYEDRRQDRVFFLDTIDPVQDEIKDFPDTGLYRVNMLKYNVSPDMGGVTYDGVCKWKAFLSVDLDRDGIKEVIVQRDSGSMMSLHYAGGEVYMTKVPNSLGYEIYENGVWTATNGAFGICYWRIYPAKGAMYIQKLAEENRRGYGSPLETYMIMDKSVTMEEHDAYVEQLVGGLTPLEWYDFTEENIDRYVID